MDDADLWRFMALLPIQGKTAVPLHRVLAHTLWRRSPVAVIHYDAQRDRLLIQMVDAPTVAEAVFCDPAAPSSRGQVARMAENGQFIGFDGTDPQAWLTVLSLRDFRRQRQAGDMTLTLFKKLCGEHIWQAALAAAYDTTTKSAAISIGTEAATTLIDRWRNIIAPPQTNEISSPEFDQTFANWADHLGNQLSWQPGARPDPVSDEPNGWDNREPR
jgi:hypothetical protein